MLLKTLVQLVLYLESSVYILNFIFDFIYIDFYYSLFKPCDILLTFIGAFCHIPLLKYNIMVYHVCIPMPMVFPF